jgi:hypothetical protein
LEGLLLAAAAIIVTYNSEDCIGECLDSLANMAPHVKPIVVDNASSDATLARVRERTQVQVIANPENKGFAAAVNQGIAACEDQHLLLLNPDVTLLTSVDALVAATQQYGMAAGKLVDLDGRAQAGFTIRRLPTPASLIFELFGINRLWPSNPVNRRYRYLDRSPELPGAVEQPAGAFLMIRRDVWRTLGGLDEGFSPVWFEDVDLCKRALDSGVRIEFVPVVEARHQGGHSVGRIHPGCRALYWCVSLTRYAAKHFHQAGYRAVCLSVVLSSIPRMVARMILDRSIDPAAVYSKIVRFAGLCLVSFGRSAARGGRIP